MSIDTQERETAEAGVSRQEARRLLDRVRWPDGPVCPYCGERERFAAEPDGSIRYECSACGSHRGHLRRPIRPSMDHTVQRRSIVPRFPGG